MKRCELQALYDRLRAQLASRGATAALKVPRLLHPTSGAYTVSGLSLLFFYMHKGRIVTKQALLQFLSRYRAHIHGGLARFIAPHPRHLGMQHGFHFLIKDSYHPQARRTLRAGEYCLYSVTKPHPSFTNHRSTAPSRADFAALKCAFDHRCAVCGSREGEASLKNKVIMTRLERGHMDPGRPLTLQNTIPMCTFCNQVYKDRFVFDARGVVVRPHCRGASVEEPVDGNGRPDASVRGLRRIGAVLPRGRR